MNDIELKFIRLRELIRTRLLTGVSADAQETRDFHTSCDGMGYDYVEVMDALVVETMR